MITVTALAIPDVKLLMPKVHQDNRGYFVEIAHDQKMHEAGINLSFKQENQSFSKHKNTVRGLHSQCPPHAQAKLVRVLRGKIFDVAVDVRPGSPTYGKHVSQVLSDQDIALMLIPVGFLHGFCTLEDNTVVSYKTSDFYAPGNEVGVLWNDPDLGIAWPIDPAQAILSPKDEILPAFKDFPSIVWSA